MKACQVEFIVSIYFIIKLSNHVVYAFIKSLILRTIENCFHGFNYPAGSWNGYFGMDTFQC